MIDVERWHEWIPGITRIQKLDPGPLRLGSRARVHQPKLLPNVWTVIDFVDHKAFTWQSRSPGVLVTGRHSVEPVGKGSRVRLAVEFSGPLAGVISALMGPRTKRYLDMESDGLKRRCEDAATTLTA